MLKSHMSAQMKLYGHPVGQVMTTGMWIFQYPHVVYPITAGLTGIVPY